MWSPCPSSDMVPCMQPVSSAATAHLSTTRSATWILLAQRLLHGLKPLLTHKLQVRPVRLPLQPQPWDLPQLLTFGAAGCQKTSRLLIGFLSEVNQIKIKYQVKEDVQRNSLTPPFPLPPPYAGQRRGVEQPEDAGGREATRLGSTQPSSWLSKANLQWIKSMQCHAMASCNLSEVCY